MIQDPTILAVGLPEAVLHVQSMMALKGMRIGGQASFPVIRMYAKSPTVAQFLFQITASELQPTPAEKSFELIWAREPNQCRRRVCHIAKALFALLQRGVRLLAFRNVFHHDNESLRLSSRVSNQRLTQIS